MGFTTNLKLMYDDSRIHKGTAMWEMPSFVLDPVAALLNSHMV